MFRKKPPKKDSGRDSAMSWPQVQRSEQSPSLCWKNVSREKLLQYAVTEQVKKLLFYLYGCGDDKIVLAILQFLSSWPWHFTFILPFSKSQHIVFRNQIHYTFCRTYYKCCNHIHIWCSCLFSAVCWAFFMLFQLLRFFGVIWNMTV